MQTFRFEHLGLLGTMIDISVAGSDKAGALRANDQAIAEISRLERVFSAFDEHSELCRWRRGEAADTSTEFDELMSRALDLQLGSGGKFNPLAGELTALWRQAEVTGHPPTQAQLDETVSAIAEPRFEIVAGTPMASGDCSALNLNAIAKGYIVDRALQLATTDEVRWVSINAGGDVAHASCPPGSGSVRVGVENPHRPYDNEPPLVVIDLADSALATSGVARRGFRVGTKWFGHVLDPRTGWPVEQIASISVLAPNALMADELTTVAGVLEPGEAMELLQGSEGIEGLIIDREGDQWPTSGWSLLLAT